jgi:hypothetical protein
MAEAVKATNGKAASTLLAVLNVVVTLVAIGVGRAYPLPVGILAVIYFSIVLGITINKRNIAKANGEDDSKLTKEIRGYIAWVIFIAAVLGLQVWSAGGFQAKSLNSYQSPTELASEGAQQAKSSTTLPYQVDEVTTLTDITSADNTIQYHYTLHDADTSSLTNEALKSSIKPSVCANTSTTNLLNRGVNLQYLYAVSGSEQYSFLVTQTDCQG